jgi:hypothetical protein
LYQLPVRGFARMDGCRYKFAPDDPRAGILTVCAYLMLDRDA